MGRVCEMCPDQSPSPATVFCPADACFLCAACDDTVHSANRLARRHVRRAVVEEELADGSSINDESELALVPDVSPLHTSLPDADSSPSSEMLSLPSSVPLSYEDAAEFDFCDFEALGPKMPALCAIDDDAMFAEAKALGRPFYPDLSWESVVPEPIEHVVPDVSEPTRPLAFLKREPSEVDVLAPKVVSVKPSVCKDKVRATTVVNRVAKALKKEEDVLVKAEPTLSSSSEATTVLGKRKACEEPELEDVKTDAEAEAEKDLEAKKVELRKKRRMEALARFRSKRANRSFTKRVRYECRKQLADSRPRVKGRFVRKIEMALFRKYGALYREHLDELKQPQPAPAATKVASAASGTGEQCISAL